MQEPISEAVRNITPSEAEHLVSQADVRILDVRTPAEYRELGHIPGATLLPVDLIACAVATLPREGQPLLVYCEHGVRSAHAARFLARAGFPQVLNLSGGMSCWRGKRDHTPGNPYGATGPSSWLIECAGLLPPGGGVLDLACGRGRHALLLAVAGLRVKGVDRDEAKISALRADAALLGVSLDAEVIDLEGDVSNLGHEEYDVILGVHYLHRPLFPAITRALRSAGLLLYETFTIHQAARGEPKNPAFLLEPGELPRLVAPLQILREREGEFDGRMISAVAARKPARS